MALSRGSKGFLVVLLILAAGSLAGLSLLRSPPSELADQPVTVTVPEGAGAGQIAQILEERGVIKSGFAFGVGARLDGRADRIRPGTYELRPGMSTGEILTLLTAAPPPAPSFRVTIPEGLTVEQTVELLASADGSRLTEDQLRAALSAVALPEWVPRDTLPAEQPYEGLTPYEGLLFPDTYEFLVDEDPVAVLGRLVARTEQAMAQFEPPPGLDRYRVLVLASLIEREARLPEEQEIVSSVIHNRLSVDMRLDIDATVLYANAADTDRVLISDTELDSPWNTYRTAGLPPTPISGAGQGAIAAAAAPADTPFRFYVVSDPETGEHAFAETLEEHNQNVARYRELQSGE
ncbi:MAG: endolytic transglycosylase MltG [Nitriliruptorales bacterium]|nr:endolytic transglycosylase MltG [Nitriliruptorales bacterium]